MAKWLIMKVLCHGAQATSYYSAYFTTFHWSLVFLTIGFEWDFLL
jgi:hypothetical protein